MDIDQVNRYVQNMKENIGCLDSILESSLVQNQLVSVFLECLEDEDIIKEFKKFFKGLTQLFIICWKGYYNKRLEEEEKKESIELRTKINQSFQFFSFLADKRYFLIYTLACHYFPKKEVQVE